MKKIQLKSVKLSFFVIKQAKRYIAYSPALDISTCGETRKQAEARFKEIIDIFFKELIEKDNLNEVLNDLGWEKIDKNWAPPEIISEKLVDIRVPLAV